MATTGKVGVGTMTPVVQLDISGAMKIGNDASACSSTTAGSMRYNSTSSQFEFCDGTSWKTLALQNARHNVRPFTDPSPVIYQNVFDAKAA